MHGMVYKNEMAKINPKLQVQIFMGLKKDREKIGISQGPLPPPPPPPNWLTMLIAAKPRASNYGLIRSGSG